MKKILSVLLIVVFVMSLSFTAFAAEDDTYVQGGWEYSIQEDGTAVILAAPDTVKQTMCVFVPGELGGAAVSQFGNGTQNVMSNNKNAGNYVLYPEGLETISAISTYDFNDTVGWSIPASVTDVTAGSWSSCGGVLFAFDGSAAATVDGKTIISSDTETTAFTISGSEGGYVTPEGTYYVPNDMITNGFSVEIMIESAENYKIASVSVDGEITEYTTKTTSAKVDYSLSKLTKDSAVIVEFAPLAEGETEDRDFSEAETELVTDIAEGAVADNAELPEDVFYAGYTSSANYDNALGICTGDWYVYEGQLYQMVVCNQSSEFNTKAEAINYYFENEGLVFGQDYDLIKLWIYGANGGSSGGMGGGGGDASGEASDSASGEATDGASAEATDTASSEATDTASSEANNSASGETADSSASGEASGESGGGGGFGGSSGFNACYLYKRSDTSIDDYTQENGGTDEACLMAEGVGTYEVTDFTAIGSMHGAGPSECLNFYGNGSQIHVNGGTGEKLTSSDIFADGVTTRLILNQTHVIGEANSVYATGQGQLVINGGDYFSCESCGHGPYCSLGGQILINALDGNYINEDGSVNIIDPVVLAIPDNSLAGMTQDEEGNNEMVLNDHDDNTTVVVTGMDAGTCLATDSGGGVIVANQVVTKSYGLRSAGVYTIGSDESWVYLFNSDCTSMQDAGLCSASSGYAFAFNCRLQGPQGLKTRASSNASTENSGLWVENSRVAAYFDAEDFEESYPVGSPEEMIETYGEAAGIAPYDEENETYYEFIQRADEALYKAIMEDGSISFDMSSTMVLFVDPANTDKYNSGSLGWWFLDRSLTPGHSGGNKFAVIYATGSAAPISVTATMLTNDNYTLYGPESEWYQSLSSDEKEAYTPADNLLISVENGGTANVFFTDENSQTKWDLTGESDETCELIGDFYLSVPCDGSEPGTVAGKENTINAEFNNSEWTGCVKYADDTGVCNLIFNASSWTVTEETTINSLTVDKDSVINASITVDGQAVDVSEGGSWEGVIVLTPVENGESATVESDAGSSEASEEAPAEAVATDSSANSFGTESGGAQAGNFLDLSINASVPTEANPEQYTADEAGWKEYMLDCAYYAMGTSDGDNKLGSTYYDIMNNNMTDMFVNMWACDSKDSFIANGGVPVVNPWNLGEGQGTPDSVPG